MLFIIPYSRLYTVYTQQGMVQSGADPTQSDKVPHHQPTQGSVTQSYEG